MENIIITQEEGGIVAMENHFPAQPDLKEKAMRLLYPPICVFCGKALPISSSLWVCDQCKPQVVITESAWQPRALSPAINGCYAPFLYQGVIKQAIHVFKFENQPRFAETLAWYIASGLRQMSPMPDFDCIVAVPMTKKRERQRGHNQASWLAAALSRYLEIPVDEHLLVRDASKKMQHTLDKKERQKNLAGHIRTNARVTDNSCILLVDDVLTTGSTMSVCAEALQAAGAKWIFGACIAFA